MCGRYNIVTDAGALVDAFDIIVNEFGENLLDSPRFNVPPTSILPLVRLHESRRTLSPAHWGLLPHWAKDKKLAFKTFNARSETITEKASFRSPIKKSRCVVPSTGWFEWRKEGDVKQPYYFDTGALIPFAGVCAWHPEFELLSFSIITTSANTAVSEIHHRMPVILEPDRVDDWMSPETGMPHVLSMLKPYEGDDVAITRVSTKMNNTRYNEPDCIEGVRVN